MNAAPDNTLADPELVIADLRRQLAEHAKLRRDIMALKADAMRRGT